MSDLVLGSTTVLSDSSGTPKLSSSVFPAGHIIQTQFTQVTTNASTTISATNTDYVVMSGTATASGSGLLDVNITPKITGSKIWLQCNWTGEFGSENNVHDHIFFFWRNTTKLANTESSPGNRKLGISPATRTFNAADDDSTLEHLFMQYFDTHGISAGTQITYKLGVIVSSSSDTLHTNRCVDDANNTTGYERGVSSLVAIELAP